MTTRFRGFARCVQEHRFLVFQTVDRSLLYCWADLGNSSSHFNEGIPDWDEVLLNGIKRSPGPPQMDLFVPVPWTADWVRDCRSWTRRGSPIHPASSMNCEPSAPENISTVRGVAVVGAPTSAVSWSRPRGGVLDASSTLFKAEGNLWDSWVERPITLTLLGYEILKERAKFTVYKILVTGGQGDSWVIFRRYNDFCRLSDKLKELFPGLGLALPPKRWFKDNYDEEFLEERQIGLQTFLQDLKSHKNIMSSEDIRCFLCFTDPPSPYYSLEESRAFCETLEETNHRLQRELLENQREVDTLKKTLEEKEAYFSFLVAKFKALSLSSESFEGSGQLTALIATDRGDSHVNGFKPQHMDDGGADHDRGYSVTEVDCK